MATNISLLIFRVERETEQYQQIFLYLAGLNCVPESTLDTGEAHRENISVFPVSRVEAGKEEGDLEWVQVSQSTLFSEQVSVLLTEIRPINFKDQIKGDRMPAFG